MAQTNNNINYTGEDLLSYALGQMNPQQMHALEKAAMEDPFLAEALDGYMEAYASIKNAPNQNIIAEKLAGFRNNIGEKEKQPEQAKVIPFYRQKWLQYAIAACVLLGGGWWVLSLTQNENAPNEKQVIIAQNEPAATLTDSVSKAETITPAAIQPLKQTDTSLDYPFAVKENRGKKEKPVASPGLAKKEDYYKTTGTESRLVNIEKNETAKAVTEDALSKTSTAAAPVFKDQTATQNDNDKYAKIQNKPVVEANANNVAYTRRYTFNGKVVDANNNPLPFSNVMIPGEGVGTYSDAKGNFNFVYVDSTLPVRARSLGYEEKNYTMQPDVKENRIVLSEDEELKRKMVVNRQEKQARNQLYKPTVVEKDSLFNAEPSVGWSDYNLYALNNTRTIELPNKRSVSLSFDVSKTGEVENITIEKSSGKELDEEAIRLLKEGPKWKAKNGSRSRAKVTIKL